MTHVKNQTDFKPRFRRFSQEFFHLAEKINSQIDKKLTKYIQDLNLQSNIKITLHTHDPEPLGEIRYLRKKTHHYFIFSYSQFIESSEGDYYCRTWDGYTNYEHCAPLNYDDPGCDTHQLREATVKLEFEVKAKFN